MPHCTLSLYHATQNRAHFRGSDSDCVTQAFFGLSDGRLAAMKLAKWRFRALSTKRHQQDLRSLSQPTDSAAQTH